MDQGSALHASSNSDPLPTAHYPLEAAAYNITMPDEVPLSFEAGLQQLEAIVKEMESGELPLEKALELFERGMKQLEEAESRVEILMRRAGEMQPQPFRNDKG